MLGVQAKTVSQRGKTQLQEVRTNHRASGQMQMLQVYLHSHQMYTAQEVSRFVGRSLN